LRGFLTRALRVFGMTGLGDGARVFEMTGIGMGAGRNWARLVGRALRSQEEEASWG
jgi:hypothetical protein